MKVNMSLIEDKELESEDIVLEEENEEEEDEFDNSDKHSKLKTFLLVAAMIGGLGLFVWNMTGLVNNMRLDNQGYASNIVYDMQEVGNFMDSSEGSGATAVGGIEESEVSTDAARDGPVTENVTYANESEEMAALRQETENAKNEAELVKQELKNAEDMLDSSLAREAELQNQLNGLSGNN